LPVIGSVPAAPRISCPEGFGVQLSFHADRVDVAVRGELDVATVPTLRTALDGLVDGGHHRMVLDLAEVEFIGAAGLNGLVATQGRLRRAGGSLQLRAVPPQVARLLRITALDATFDVEGPNPDATLRSHLTRAATQPERNRAVDARLSMLVAVAAATVGGADGVSVTLKRHGDMSTVAATNDTVLRMDAHQYATGEGPCISAAQGGETFVVDAIAGDARWPTFAPLASEEGIASILSTPLLAVGAPVGALNIYSNTEDAFGSYQQELAAIIADQASTILGADSLVEMSDEEMAARITVALRSRLVLAQAQGVLMGRHRLTADAATDVLHRMARSAEVSVLAHASSVVASTQGDVGPVERAGDG
jgi:anti-anti-sigma factor